MERLRIDHLTSSTDGPEVRPEGQRPGHPLDVSPPSIDETGDAIENLAQSEIMLRTAIEALSPDADEIQSQLERCENGVAPTTDRPSSFRLAVIAVVLVFLILTLDLFLTGG